MLLRVGVCCVAACLAVPDGSGAQTVEPSPSAITSATYVPRETSDPQGFWAPFQAIPNDFARFFSSDTMKIVGFGSASALMVHRWDSEGIEEAQEHFRPSMFRVGNIGGGLLTQVGASFGLYSAAKLAGSDTLANVGADLIRAQILSQGFVQAGKMATRRTRPDASNNHSLPSGHTAAAFATATVLKDHFGWKAGIPAYGFGAYVAASRMSANKHHLSDVALGAAIGLAAGRTVTLGSGKARFNMNLAPRLGGAAITFTKQ